MRLGALTLLDIVVLIVANVVLGWLFWKAVSALAIWWVAFRHVLRGTGRDSSRRGFHRRHVPRYSDTVTASAPAFTDDYASEAFLVER
jgi:hypothetical protein